MRDGTVVDYMEVQRELRFYEPRPREGARRFLADQWWVYRAGEWLSERALLERAKRQRAIPEGAHVVGESDFRQFERIRAATPTFAKVVEELGDEHLRIEPDGTPVLEVKGEKAMRELGEMQKPAWRLRAERRMAIAGATPLELVRAPSGEEREVPVKISDAVQRATGARPVRRRRRKKGKA